MNTNQTDNDTRTNAQSPRLDSRHTPDARRSMEAFALMREELARERSIKSELLAALNGLFKNCTMMHKHWGNGSNQSEADAAISAAQAAITKAEGTAQP